MYSNNVALGLTKLFNVKITFVLCSCFTTPQNKFYQCINLVSNH